MLEPKDTARYERELRAMLRRAGDEDPEGFATIAKLLTQACEGLPLAAELTKVEHGYSWAQLAAPLRVSRQAMQQRFGVSTQYVDELQASTDDGPEWRIRWTAGLRRLITLQIGEPSRSPDDLLVDQDRHPHIVSRSAVPSA